MFIEILTALLPKAKLKHHFFVIGRLLELALLSNKDFRNSDSFPMGKENIYPKEK